MLFRSGARFAVVGPAVAGPVDLLSEAFAVRRLGRPAVALSCPDYATLATLLPDTDLLAVVPHPVLLGAAAARLRGLALRERLPLYEVCVFTRSRPRGVIEPLRAALRQAGATLDG